MNSSFGLVIFFMMFILNKIARCHVRRVARLSIAEECCVLLRKSELDEMNGQVCCCDGVAKFPLSTGLPLCHTV